MNDWANPFIIGLLAASGSWWFYVRLYRGVAIKTGLIFSTFIGLIGYFLPSAGKVIAVVFFVGAISLEIRRNLKKKQFAHSHYLYEGGGIKRGLSPVEVGSLFKLKPSELFVLGVIELFQKGFIKYSFIQNRRMKLTLAEDFLATKKIINPKLKREVRQTIAYQQLKELTSSEDILLETIAQNSEKAVGEIPIQPWIEFLNRSIEDKLFGYDPTQTITYYKDFISHRLKGLEAGHFHPEDYNGWIAAGLYLDENLYSLSEKLLKKTRHAWLSEGESFSNWLKVFMSDLG